MAAVTRPAHQAPIPQATGPQAFGPDPARLRFAGYAALFDRRDGGRDVIRRGAFARSLAARRGPLPLYWQHRPDQQIGWIESLAEDDRGLRVTAAIDNPAGGAAAALTRGAVTGLSFGYVARGFKADGIGRELTEIDLFEVSLVTHPMQPGARVHWITRPGPDTSLSALPPARHPAAALQQGDCPWNP